MPTLRILLHWNIVIAVILSSTLVGNELVIEERVSEGRYGDAVDIPYNRVALVLGTLPTACDGSPNPFFWARMASAAELYCSGKVQHLLLSGDGWIWGVNEPEEMRSALLAMGIPDEDMTLDFAGIDTYRSVLRAKHMCSGKKRSPSSVNRHTLRVPCSSRSGSGLKRSRSKQPTCPH